MTRILVLCLLTVMWVPACGEYSGHFCATGTESTRSTTDVGALIIVNGRSVENGRATGSEQNLVYLMVICSGVKPGPTQGVGGGIEGNPMSNPKIYSEWETTSGTARVSLDWETHSDTISIGDEKFNRKNGNTFFIERKTDGRLVAQQCGNLGPAANFSQVAAKIREMLKDNNIVGSAKFRQVDN